MIDLGGNRLLASLTPAERERLGPALDLVGLRLGDVLARRREPVSHLYFPAGSLGSNVIELEEGDEIEVGTVGREGVTAVNVIYGVAEANTTCVVQVPGPAYRVATAVIAREVAEKSGPFSRRLLRYANAFMQIVAYGAACNVSHSVEQRCARWILMAADGTGGETVALTHEYLSIMLGVRRASVSSAAATLRLAGAIDYGRGTVAILDRPTLDAAACDCYRAIKAILEWGSA